MKVKRFIANDIHEAMIKVRNELGRDAIILHTRKIKKPGIRGLIQKPFIEVVAAMDDNKDVVTKELDNSIRKASLTRNNVIENTETIDSQIDSIKNMLNTVLTKLNSSPNSSSDTLVKFQNMLFEKNISKPIVDKILEIVSHQISFTEKNEQTIKNAIKIAIKEYLGKPYLIDQESKNQKVIFLVGPTGVGKTTTLAKLAAKFSIVNNKSVALITSDTYRIAAVEQLKTYSEILNVPLTVVYEPMEIKEAIESYKDKNYIFVDTAGRNHKNQELLNELEKIISFAHSPEVFLLISLTTGYEDISSIIDSYNFLDDYKIIFTKMDEASFLGNILNVKMLTSKPLSYITTGQSVPDDIEVADTDKIANCIVGE